MRLVKSPRFPIIWATVVTAILLSTRGTGGQKSSDLELVMNVGHGGPVRQLAFTPDGRELLSVAGDGTLRLWDTGRGTLLRSISAHSEVATTTAISFDGALAATGGDDKISQIWSIETGALIHEEQFDARVSQVSWAPHDRQLAVVAGMEIRVL